MTGPGNEAGFTLIELMVAMTLSMIVLGATLDAFAGFDSRSRAVNVQNDAQDNVRHSMDQLARELRNAVSSGSPTATPVEKATPNDLIFQTVDSAPAPAGSLNAQNLKRVRYCLDSSTPSRERLWKQTQRWTSASAPTPAPSSTICPSSAWDPWGRPVAAADRLVNNVDPGQSRPVWGFSYSPAGSADPADIAGIKTNLFVNVEPAKASQTAELTSAVRLRNSNRRPTSLFTVSQQNGHVLLNASSSVDPEGQALSYQWSVDGATIAGATNARLDYPGLTSGTTHSFTLQVTDPGGLSDQKTLSVTIQ